MHDYLIPFSNAYKDIITNYGFKLIGEPYQNEELFFLNNERDVTLRITNDSQPEYLLVLVNGPTHGYRTKIHFSDKDGTFDRLLKTFH